MIDTVLDKTYHLNKTLKDSSRSMVYLINVNDESLILKEPVEKNERKWIRFTTLLRKSEALQSCLSMIKLQEIGVESNKPLVVVEKKKLGMVVDSWYLCSFVEGVACSQDAYQNVVETLNKIHQSGYLHGDPQIRNFLQTDTGIQVIDAKMNQYLSAIQCQLELVYLNNSARQTSPYIDRSSLSYKIAEFIMNTIQRLFRSFKHTVRQLFHA